MSENFDAATLAGIQACREGYQRRLAGPVGPSNTVKEPFSMENDTSHSTDARPKAWLSSFTNEGGHGATTIPHGERPTPTLFRTVCCARSITDASLELPLAV